MDIQAILDGFDSVATKLSSLIASVGTGPQFDISAPVPVRAVTNGSAWRLDGVAQPGDFYVFAGTFTYSRKYGARQTLTVQGIVDAASAGMNFLILGAPSTTAPASTVAVRVIPAIIAEGTDSVSYVSDVATNPNGVLVLTTSRYYHLR